MTGFPPLQEITVEITQQCLQRCVHCSSVASSFSRQALTKNEVVNIAQDFVDLGGKTIELSGGEPFLHSDIFGIIPLLKNLGLKVNIFTCGEIARSGNFETTVKKTVKALKSCKVDKIVFSIHGANARTHDDIARTGNSFSHAVKFMKELINEKMYVGIHFVPMSTNFEEFRDLVDFAAKLGVKEISVLRFVPQGRGGINKNSLVLNKGEVAQLVELLTETEKRNDIRVKVGSHLDFTFLLDGNRPKECMAGIRKCLIESNGYVIPCAVFKGMKDTDENDYIAGNVRKSSLREIWQTSDIFEKFRTFNPKSLKGECRTCQYLLDCKGRCPAQRIYDHGDFYQGPDNYCPKELFQGRLH
jgi:radical SAM protein with 4Fe4S-binding SPASM domain